MELNLLVSPKFSGVTRAVKYGVRTYCSSRSWAGARQARYLLTFFPRRKTCIEPRPHLGSRTRPLPRKERPIRHANKPVQAHPVSLVYFSMTFSCVELALHTRQQEKNASLFPQAKDACTNNACVMLYYMHSRILRANYRPCCVSRRACRPRPLFPLALTRPLIFPLFQVEENSWVLHQTVLRLSGGGLESSLSIDAVFAPFSPPPAESVLGPVVLSVPPTADRVLENEEGVKGRCVCIFMFTQSVSAAAVYAWEIARAFWTIGGVFFVSVGRDSKSTGVHRLAAPHPLFAIGVGFVRSQPEDDTYVGGWVQVEGVKKMSCLFRSFALPLVFFV